MSWYYVSNNEKQGPVEQAQFEQLVQQCHRPRRIFTAFGAKRVATG